MADTSEDYRRSLQAEINAKKEERQAIESAHGKAWDTEELQRDFEVVGFGAPFVVVVRKSDGQRGSLEFQHRPRFYYGFVPDRR